jgi:hypothetical protein
MKLANKIVLPLLVVITGVITSGCSGTGKPQRTYLDETRNLPARASTPTSISTPNPGVVQNAVARLYVTLGMSIRS